MTSVTPGYYLPAHYLPVALFIAVAVGFGVVNLIIASFVRPNKPYYEKLSPYECGLNPFTDARQRFSIRFYIITMLFLLFDVETVFMYPWAINYLKLGMFGLVEMFLFILVLFVGYVYAWMKGALEWD